MTRKDKMDIVHPYGPWMLVTNYRQRYFPGRTQKSQSDYRSEAEGNPKPTHDRDFSSTCANTTVLVSEVRTDRSATSG